MEFDKFLEPYGLYFIDIVISEETAKQIKGYHLINGKSPRGDYFHSIVGKDGKAIHDPFPGGNCHLVTVETYTLFLALIDKPPLLKENK